MDVGKLTGTRCHEAHESQPVSKIRISKVGTRKGVLGPEVSRRFWEMEHQALFKNNSRSAGIDFDKYDDIPVERGGTSLGGAASACSRGVQGVSERACRATLLQMS